MTAPPAKAPDTPDPPPSRFKLFVFAVVLLLVASGLALAVGEGLVRLAAPQQLPQVRPDIWAAEDGLGWVNRPDVRTTINTGERTVDLFTDRDGYRVGAAGRVEAPVRLLLIGDSFIEALQVPYEQSFAGLLQQRAAGYLGGPVAVRNIGTDGWEPNQYLLEARRRLARDSFAITVVGIYLGNDVVGNRVEGYPARAPAERHHLRLPRRLAARELIDAIFYPVNDALETRSHLFILLKHRLAGLLMRIGLSAAYFPQELRRSFAASPAWGVTADLCRDLADTARSRGSAVLFLLIPAPHQVDEQVLRQYLRGFRIDSSTVDADQPNRLLGAELARRGVPFLDILPAFRAAHGRGVKLYGTVDKHLTVEGNDLLEQLAAPKLAEAMRSRPRPSSSRRGRA